MGIFFQPFLHQGRSMAPKAMKAAAAKAMSQSGTTAAIATATGLKAADCKKVLASLAAVGTKEVKSTGKFTIPGLAMLKLKTKPATKIVKAFAVAALKKSV